VSCFAKQCGLSAHGISSVNDFSLASIAAATGRTEDFKKYFNRSLNWRNHWNVNLTALNFTGFVGPREANGTFLDQDPLSCGGCYWGDYYYEALPWAYSLNAKHDIDHLVELCAGKDKFVERLEMTFTPGVVAGGSFNGTIMDPSNEPMFNTPYLYSYVNRPDLSVERSRFIAKQYYFPTPGGLPGNSDAGAMESWLLWNMIGLYPQSGQTTFFIGSPWFSDLTISLGGGKELKMTARGGSETAYHVQSLHVNGKHWDKTWLSYYDIFAHGGTMEFVLGDKPVQWATGATPPSPGSMNPQDAMKLLQRMSKGSTA
jgi:putative alpha-1,2-mannosidase